LRKTALCSAGSAHLRGAVNAFYAERAATEGIGGGKTGSVTVVQRTSSDLRLNPHLHLVALDGA
jgi:hypothetical protein